MILFTQSSKLLASYHTTGPVLPSEGQRCPFRNQLYAGTLSYPQLPSVTLSYPLLPSVFVLLLPSPYNGHRNHWY